MVSEGWRASRRSSASQTPRSTSARATPTPLDAQAALWATWSIVLFGGSSVDAGLSQTLRPKFNELNTRYVALGKFNTMLGQWANNGEISSYHWAYHPSLFIVTLGAS